MSNIVGPDGKPVQTNSIPCVMWGEFTLPIRVLSKNDAVDPKSSVTPGDVIKEMRASYMEMQDRFTLLSIGMAIQAKANPGGEMDQYLSQIGVVLKDLQGKVIYEPSPQYNKATDSSEETSEE